MGSIDLNYKEGLEKYKGKIIGFTMDGRAAYPNEVGLNALDTCDCCGVIIHSQLSDADFCPVCSVQLGLVSEDLAREICISMWESSFVRLYTDIKYDGYYKGLIRGFKQGIKFGLENATCTLGHKIKFDLI